MPINTVNQFDVHTLSKKKFAYEQRAPHSPVSPRMIRFDEGNNRVYDFMPSQAVRQSAATVPHHNGGPAERRALNGSYMSNSINSSFSGGMVYEGDVGGGGRGVINRASSASSSSSSSSVFLDRKESVKLGLHYLPSSMGYSSIGTRKTSHIK